MTAVKHGKIQFSTLMLALGIIMGMIGWFGNNIDARIEDNESSIVENTLLIGVKVNEVRSEGVADFRAVKKSQVATDLRVTGQEKDIGYLIKLVEKIDSRLP